MATMDTTRQRTADSTRGANALSKTDERSDELRKALAQDMNRVTPNEIRAEQRVLASNAIDDGFDRAPLSSTKTLRQGARGPAVVDLQEQLNARGANLKTDGIFGMRTENAVRAFQRSVGTLVDGIVGPKTRAAFARTAEGPAPAPGTPEVGGGARGTLRKGHDGPEVSALQQQLNEVAGANLRVDGDFGNATRAAVEDFQNRAGIDVDGEVGPQTYKALDDVAAGRLELREPTAQPPVGPTRPTGPASRQVTIDGNTFGVHDMTRSQFGRTSVPGNRIISMDSNSVRGREEILPPMIVIPNNATAQERRAAQAAVDGVAGWLKDNLGGNRRSTGIVKTTAENGRGLGGFFHTEFHSVNDSRAVNLIRENSGDYARILGTTLGSIPGANFIVPHGDRRGSTTDPGAVSADGRTTEVNLAQHVIRNGFSQF